MKSGVRVFVVLAIVVFGAQLHAFGHDPASYERGIGSSLAVCVLLAAAVKWRILDRKYSRLGHLRWLSHLLIGVAEFLITLLLIYYCSQHGLFSDLRLMLPVCCLSEYVPGMVLYAVLAGCQVLPEKVKKWEAALVYPFIFPLIGAVLGNVFFVFVMFLII